MEYFWWLYFATRLDEIRSGFTICIFIGVFLFVTSMMATIDLGREKTRAYRWSAVGVFILGMVGSVLVPSKQDAMFIAGGVGVIEASKAIAGSEIAKKSVSIVEQWLTNELENMKTKSKKQ